MNKIFKVGIRLNIFILLFLTLLINNFSNVYAMNSYVKIEKNSGIEVEKVLQNTTNKEFNTQQNNIEKNSYTEEELDLLARLMYAEVGVFIQTLPEEEAKEAHILTGSVVLNRVKVELGGAQTIEEVVYYHIGDTYQYTCVKNGTINNQPPEIVYEWAREILENGPQGPSDMIYQATFKQGTSTYKQIGNTYFCCKEGIAN